MLKQYQLYFQLDWCDSWKTAKPSPVHYTVFVSLGITQDVVPHQSVRLLDLP